MISKKITSNKKRNNEEKLFYQMAMLAMVGATATAQKNNEGLTPSRPLTSGELFKV